MAIALGANTCMCLVGLVGWYVAQSTALLADALDMLADASGYGVAWLAIGRSMRAQQRAARWNAGMLFLLGAVVIAEVAERWIHGSEPEGSLIAAFAVLSLVVNGGVLIMLSPYRRAEEVHLRATWVDTRADVLVNLAVLLSGAAIAVTGWRQIDLLVGLAISLYVIKEGWEIWETTTDR
ncbi:MAG TPA: cation diffusion facilitator family transporter [Stellaceae bacterium]|nr:cation diffusion facilitator family transporter [Stellaceae bacterium]